MNILQAFLKNSFFFILFSFIFVFSKNVYAHENVMFEYRVFFKFDNFNVTDIGESWTFDKITSAELIEEYNVDTKIKLNEKQSRALGKRIVEHLLEVRYFTYISVNNIDIGSVKASNFKAQIKNEIISLAFANHLPSPVNVKKDTLSIEVKDPDLSVITVLSQKKPVIFIGASKDMCQISITQAKDPSENIFSKEDILNDDLIFPSKKVSIICK